jgi:phosphate transport system substrate-binding protein
MSGELNPPADAGTPKSEPQPTINRRSGSRTGIYAAVAVVIIVLLLVGVGYGTNWYGTQKKASTTTTPPVVGACPTGQALSGAGAQPALALMSTWTQDYQTASSNTLSYSPSGSGSGLTSFTDKDVDFAVTDDPLNTTQTSALPSPALTLPITGSALTIVYNLPGVTKPIQLSGPTLADIFLGDITNWNDSRITVNNSGITFPNQTIVTVHRSDAAGLTYVLTNLLAKDSSAWNSGPGEAISVSWPKAPTQDSVKGNSLLLSTVQSTSYSIGYSDLTDTLAIPGLAYAKLLNPTGNYILPTPANAAAAIGNLSKTTSFPTAAGNWNGVTMINSPGSYDYPAATFIYLFVFQKADQGFSPSLDKTQALIQFVNWTLTEGQADTGALYYASLPSQVIANDQTGLASITYNGAAVPACG